MDPQDILFGKIERASVVFGEEEEPEDLGMVVHQGVTNGQEISQGLGHLFSFNGNKSIVDPVRGKGAAIGPDGLGPFIFVVREKEVFPAAVNVEGMAQIVVAHDRAFQVPPGPSIAPRAWPLRFTGPCPFP